MSLTLNSDTGAFVLTSDDEKTANKVGMTLSKKVRSAKGEKVWFTADYAGQPDHNQYMALPYWDEADDKARAALGNLRSDYEASWATDCPNDFPKPHRINPKTGELYAYLPYQRAGIQYGLDHGNFLIGDEPGLGKTIQAIGMANAIEAQRVLVICPASIRLGWQQEILDWSTLPRVSTYPILKSQNGVSPHANYTIISYELARNPAMWARYK